VPKSNRIRNVARSLGIDEDDALLWLMEHAPELGDVHPADFIPSDVEDRLRAALARPPASKEPPAPKELVERRCAECIAAPATIAGARVIEGTPCSRCNDSVNKRATLAVIDAFAERGLRRLLVVGGGPGTAEELRALLGGAIQLRIIDGEEHRNASQAESELAWADVAAIWGSTILPHKVSKLYTDRRADYRDKLVTVTRRGAAALCAAVVDRVKGEPLHKASR
jgi:hypothetical protein